MNKFRLGAIWLTALPLLSLVSGCATLTRGSTEAYQVTSEPPGALVTLSSGESCLTPCVIDKKRGEPFLVTIEKTGYEPYHLQVNSNGCEGGSLAMIGNLLLIGSVIWASIDSLSGATQELSPNPCRAKLTPAIFPAKMAQPKPSATRGECG